MRTPILGDASVMRSAMGTFSLLLGAHGGYAPHTATDWVVLDDCATITETTVDPIEDPFDPVKTDSEEVCADHEGYRDMRMRPGNWFAPIQIGFAVERDRVRLSLLGGVGPIVAGQPKRLTDGHEVTPSTVFTGDLSLEYATAAGPLSLSVGAAGALRAFEASGVAADGGQRATLAGAAVAGGGPTLAIGTLDPALWLRVNGAVWSDGTMGATVGILWAPVQLPVGKPKE